MDNQNTKEVISKLNELYVMTRFKYLMQSPGGQYATLDRRKHKRVLSFNDGLLESHIRGERTYGVFSGGYFSKFVTFDVDCEGRDEIARWAVYKLIAVLTEDFRIMRRDIHVSTSGSKGYHVDLFFDRPVLVSDLRRLFTSVTSEVGKLPVGNIEFRPEWGVGVKLPLGIHQKTGVRCWFLDRDTLEPYESFEYILGIQPMDASIVTDQDFGLSEEQVADFEYVARTIDPDVNIVTASDALQRARRILETGQLIESGTRHVTTVILATFFNSQGWERAHAIESIMQILHNTPREFFSKDSTPEIWRKETERIVGLAFDRDYQLGNEDKTVNVYRSEIQAVLQTGTFRTKQMAFAMLVTSKRYGRVFYFTESTAKKMIGTKSAGTVWDAVNRLERVGFIESVRRGEIDAAASNAKGRAHHKPNKYRLLTAEPAADDVYVTVSPDSDVVEVAYSLLTTDEIRQVVKRREYENRWKTMGAV